MTSDGTRFLVFALAIGIAAMNTGNNLFYLLLALMLSLIVISGFLSEHCLRRLAFQRHVPDLIMANQPATVSLAVTNRNSRLPSFSLRVKDVVDGRVIDRGLRLRHLPAGRTVLLNYPLLATGRGPLHLEQVRVETLFPFALFLKRAVFEVDAMILVGPAVKPLSLRFVDELLSEGQGQAVSRRGHGTGLYNLRLYRPGDDSRAIHWMTTARTAQLIVRETEAEDQRRVTVVLSCTAPDALDALFERSVTLAASILWHLLQRHYPVRLLVGGEDSGFGSGHEHLLSMMRLLALCQRRFPDASDAQRQGLSAIAGEDPGYTLAILPWMDPQAANDTPMADRVLAGRQLEDLTHAF
ncbi:MAG TPA: DUF58 domain-containing protein [Nitrospira sp.]|nr:DUF58 domain-containing protein [Nitrospira sp.]